MDRPRETVDGEAAAREHLEGCPDCQAFFRTDAAISGAIRRHGVPARAPQALRERVFDALARERAVIGSGQPGRKARSWHPATRFLPLGTAAALALGLGIGMFGQRAGSPDPGYVQDFLGRAAEEVVLEFPDAGAVTAFFARELGVRVQPVALQSGRMNRAMICVIDGERAAMVEYEIDGWTVAHYLTPIAEGTDAAHGDFYRGDVDRVDAGPAEVQAASEAGIQVVSWSDDRFDHALVSDLSEMDLTELARSRFTSR
jgi:anti-sigma factor RsiW